MEALRLHPVQMKQSHTAILDEADLRHAIATARTELKEG